MPATVDPPPPRTADGDSVRGDRLSCENNGICLHVSRLARGAADHGISVGVAWWQAFPTL